MSLCFCGASCSHTVVSAAFRFVVREKRDTSSISPRFIRHRRRFGEIHIGAATAAAQKRIGAEIVEIIKNF